MNLTLPKDNSKILSLFQQGEVFAYPTEAVFGLGGQPSDETYHKILTLKQRSSQKGVILVAANWRQAEPFTKGLSPLVWQRLQTWEEDGRATTFILPAHENTPQSLTEKGNIAFRVSKHPVVKALCLLCNSPLISTSANISGKAPAKNQAEVEKYFPNLPIIEGGIGNQSRPSRIIDLAHNQILRD